MRFILVLLAVCLGAVPALAAEWPSSPSEIPSLGMDATLGASGQPAAADGSGRLHLTFQNNIDGETFQVAYTSKDPDGDWTLPVIISPPGRNARNPAVAVDRDDRLHVLWEDITDGEGDIVIRTRNTDATWEEPASIAPAVGLSKHPVVDVDVFDRVHAVWVDGRSGSQEILHAIRDPATGWSQPRSLSPGGITPDDPNIDSDGIGNVHVVWTDRGATPDTRTSFDLVHLSMEPGSGGAIQPQRLIVNLRLAIRPSVEVTSDGTVHLVWLDNRAVNGTLALEIYYKRFLPDIGWGHDKRFTYDLTDHGRPAVVAGPSRTVNVAWEDYRGGNSEIYFRQITWETGWDPRSSPLTADNSSSLAPSLVALEDGRLVLFWTDAQGSGTFRIFTKIGTEIAP